MKKVVIQYFFILLGMSSAYAASLPSETPDLLPINLDNYSDVQLPDHFLTPEILALDNTPLDNPTTDAGATLGRVLFYDKKLSSNGRVSCGSCHIQKHGFSNNKSSHDPLGVDNKPLASKTPPLANLRFRNTPFGTGINGNQEQTLEDQSVSAFTDEGEMGNVNIVDVVEKVRSIPYYKKLFENAFGDSVITELGIGRALSQFTRSMLSFNSKFDQGIPLDFSNFSEEERLGRELFNSSRTRCSECHLTDLQIMKTGTSIGINTGHQSVSSLRNVNERQGLTISGLATGLKDMLIHYNRTIPMCGEVFCTEVTPPLQDDLGNFLVMNLSEDEEDAIISYLRTLSDPVAEITIDENGKLRLNENSLLFDSKFSDPFFEKPRNNSEHVHKIVPSINLLLNDK